MQVILLRSVPMGIWRAPDGTFWRLFPDGGVEPRF
jgi:hypothetical protein